VDHFDRLPVEMVLIASPTRSDTRIELNLSPSDNRLQAIIILDHSRRIGIAENILH
jgi:hypothetical protein